MYFISQNVEQDKLAKVQEVKKEKQTYSYSYYSSSKPEKEEKQDDDPMF